MVVLLASLSQAGLSLESGLENFSRIDMSNFSQLSKFREEFLGVSDCECARAF
ncbi:hypothetical protein EMIT0324P_70241 [Pseudomonas chlororaphis]